MAINRTPLLIRCDNVDEYSKVAASFHRTDNLVLPVIGEEPSLLGLPPGTSCLSSSDWTPVVPSRPIAPAPHRYCITIDEPDCIAISRFLSNTTGRTLHVVGAEDWERAVRELVGRVRLESLTIVVPSWSGVSCTASPVWLARVLDCVRALHAMLQDVSWGIMTGVSPGALSLMTAKAVLGAEILQAYETDPAALFTTDSAEELGTDLTYPDASAPGPLQLIERSHLQSGVALSFIKNKWSLLYFRGHGRSYCACQGYLCGARPINVSSATTCEGCIQGMECASPAPGVYDIGFPAFPRIDPRSYNTPVMVLDCCGAGSWSSPSWDDGIPSLAFHALSGAAGAVLTSDCTTIHGQGNYVEVLHALWSFATLGEATSRLNRLRIESGSEFPYFLLGDPECPVGAGRWPDWCTSADILARENVSDGHTKSLVSAPIGKPFTRVTLGTIPLTSTAFLWSVDPLVQVRSPHLMPGNEAELWMAPVRRDGEADPAVISVDLRPALRLPADLLEAALSIPLQLRSWTPELLPGARQLSQAAELILKVDELLGKTRGRALLGTFDELQSCVHMCLQAWREAHLAAVEHAFTLLDGGLWPARLWRATDYQSAMSMESCPVCAGAPTVVRSYASGPQSLRRQWECVRCALIEDRPIQQLPSMSLTAATDLFVGESLVAEVVLDNQTLTSFQSAVCSVIVDRKGHGVQTDAPSCLELAPGERRVIRVKVTLPKSPNIYHRYFLRALAFVDGHWLMAARIVILRPKR